MLRGLIRSAVRNRAQLATAAAFLLGWGVLTWAIVLPTAPAVWLVSLGLLLISLGGWELLYLVVRKGFHALTRPDQEAG
jgi:hypothetical protein